MKRKAFIAFSVIVGMIGSFLFYGWWTRRGPIEFAQGGAFGLEASASPTASASTSQRDVPKQANPTPAVSVKSEPKKTKGPARVRPAGSYAPPAPGTYRYDGTGEERVSFGPASACGWDVEDVSLVVKGDADELIMDWTISDNRQQRGIYVWDREGMHQRFYGAVATCVGVRRTDEGTYQPPSTRLRFGLEPGQGWEEDAQTDGFREHTIARVLRKERIRVPAGRFDAIVYHLRTTFSDGQSGEFEATLWFAPALGVWVKEDAHYDIRASGAEFRSDHTIELREYPR